MSTQLHVCLYLGHHTFYENELVTNLQSEPAYLCMRMISPRCSILGSVSLLTANAMHLSLSLSTSVEEESQTPKLRDQSLPAPKGALAELTNSTTPKILTVELTAKSAMRVYLYSTGFPVRGVTVAVGVNGLVTREEEDAVGRARVAVDGGLVESLDGVDDPLGGVTRPSVAFFAGAMSPDTR